MKNDSKTIFDRGASDRRAHAQRVADIDDESIRDIPNEFLRSDLPALPEVSELQAVRHFTNLSKKNFSIDGQFYPLGSCTMKYNPRAAHKAASLPGFLGRHPHAPEKVSQGFLRCFFDLQQTLKELTGMKGVSLAPMAGAQGEFAGVSMIRAYHEAKGDSQRREIIVPTAAHGTNPATAVMCGYEVTEVGVGPDGDVDVDELRAKVGPQTAGLMMTNPSTCGVFERRIKEIADIVHGAGGLLYYDGANLNAILGKVKPGAMGFDVLHMNLHKTFATPHGGGGPGSGPVGVSERLLPFLPIPLVERNFGEGEEGEGEIYSWASGEAIQDSIGKLSAFSGNSGILLRAFAYALLLGGEGMNRVGEFATLNANYLAARLSREGFQLAFPERRATHEFIITFAKEAKEMNVSAMDIAKRLLDYGVHAPTTYFPLMVPECFLIEPTETEDKLELDGFVEAMKAIREEVLNDPELVRSAPHTLPVRRLDDVKAARELDLTWSPAT